MYSWFGVELAGLKLEDVFDSVVVFLPQNGPSVRLVHMKKRKSASPEDDNPCYGAQKCLYGSLSFLHVSPMLLHLINMTAL